MCWPGRPCVGMLAGGQSGQGGERRFFFCSGAGILLAVLAHLPRRMLLGRAPGALRAWVALSSRLVHSCLPCCCSPLAPARTCPARRPRRRGHIRSSPAFPTTLQNLKPRLQPTTRPSRHRRPVCPSRVLIIAVRWPPLMLHAMENTLLASV
jgi:hypothetical protein